jgi:hypothetical protein
VRHLAQPGDLTGGEASRVRRQQVAYRGKTGWLRKRSKAFEGAGFATGGFHLLSRGRIMSIFIDELDDGRMTI